MSLSWQKVLSDLVKEDFSPGISSLGYQYTGTETHHLHLRHANLSDVQVTLGLLPYVCSFLQSPQSSTHLARGASLQLTPYNSTFPQVQSNCRAPAQPPLAADTWWDQSRRDMAMSLIKGMVLFKLRTSLPPSPCHAHTCRESHTEDEITTYSDLIWDVTLSHFNSLGRAMSFSALGEIWPATEQNLA